MKALHYIVYLAVSILVIVEVTLKSFCAFSAVVSFACFNPCYSGSNSKILVEYAYIFRCF